MPEIYPHARTTPVTRVEFARSTEPSNVVSRRDAVSTETVRKWRKRGVADCFDHSTRPHRLRCEATDGERAIVCAVRREANLSVDDMTFVVCHFLPRLNRDSVWRILEAAVLSRRPKPSS